LPSRHNPHTAAAFGTAGNISL